MFLETSQERQYVERYFKYLICFILVLKKKISLGFMVKSPLICHIVLRTYPAYGVLYCVTPLSIILYLFKLLFSKLSCINIQKFSKSILSFLKRLFQRINFIGYYIDFFSSIRYTISTTSCPNCRESFRRGRTSVILGIISIALAIINLLMILYTVMYRY